MQIGRGPRQTSSELVALMLECHERIRTFARLAVAIGAQGASASEIAAACVDVRRYFREALPLHVQDEEESVLPRLRGRDGALDAALERMRDEHAEHAPQLEALLLRCAIVEADPSLHAREAAEIGRLARALERAFALHLAEEEREIFPRLRALPRQQQEEIIAELRARRRVATL